VERRLNGQILMRSSLLSRINSPPIVLGMSPYAFHHTWVLTRLHPRTTLLETLSASQLSWLLSSHLAWIGSLRGPPDSHRKRCPAPCSTTTLSLFLVLCDIMADSEACTQLKQSKMGTYSRLQFWNSSVVRCSTGPLKRL
jgi:hypothetical protein